MSTTIRPEPSRRKSYWIPRHRYYELKHFCLQYPSWKSDLINLDGWGSGSTDFSRYGITKEGERRDPTAYAAEQRDFLAERIALVRGCASKTDEVLGNYILTAVTEGLSYDTVKARLEIPCSKETFYDRYRRFFWLLSIERR